MGQLPGEEMIGQEERAIDIDPRPAVTVTQIEMTEGKNLGLVYWYESTLYVLGYVAYIVFMVYSG